MCRTVQLSLKSLNLVLNTVNGTDDKMKTVVELNCTHDSGALFVVDIDVAVILKLQQMAFTCIFTIGSSPSVFMVSAAALSFRGR